MYFTLYTICKICLPLSFPLNVQFDHTYLESQGMTYDLGDAPPKLTLRQEREGLFGKFIEGLVGK
jgi:hypothetical protein